MADDAVLQVQIREEGSRAKDLRRRNLIPAVFYGHGMDNMSLQMDYQTFRRLFRTAGENTVITLNVEGGKDVKVLVQHVDYHPVTDKFMHVEFINVRMDEKVTAHIPVHLEGQAPAVKEMGGTLIQSLDEIEIRCLPGDLIHELSHSVESLVDFNSALHVSDLQLPASIELVTDPALTLATVQPPREEEAEPEGEVDVASVEVPGEKKDEGGE